MSKHQKLTETLAANAADCARTRHSWCGSQCSWCGAPRPSGEPYELLPESHYWALQAELHMKHLRDWIRSITS